MKLGKVSDAVSRWREWRGQTLSGLQILVGWEKFSGWGVGGRDLANKKRWRSPSGVGETEVGERWGMS